MNKAWFASLLLFCGSLHAFEKMDSKYQIRFGHPDAEVQVVEYFSLSCAKCVKFLLQDFPRLKSDHVDGGQASWTFHPEPADLATVQAMMCLEKLNEEQKPLFLQAIAEGIWEQKGKNADAVLRSAMERLGIEMPAIESKEALEQSDAFENAYRFLKQEDVITIIPTVEINGKIYDQYPSPEFLDAEIRSLTKKEAL